MTSPDFPTRPFTKDFDRVSELCREQDSEIDQLPDTLAKADAFQRAVACQIDPATLAYVAMQRAFRICQVTTTAEAHENHWAVAALAAMWTEAFVTGSAFAKAGGHQDDDEEPTQ